MKKVYRLEHKDGRFTTSEREGKWIVIKKYRSSRDLAYGIPYAVITEKEDEWAQLFRPVLKEEE